MFKYLLFLLIGIILFILLNSLEKFSVGIPEFRFAIYDNGNIESEEMDFQFFTEEQPIETVGDIVDEDGNNTVVYYVYAETEPPRGR